MTDTGYCTIEELRDHIRDSEQKISTDSLARAIAATSRGIDDFCGRRFWQDASVQALLYRPDDTELAWVNDISTTTGLVVATDPGRDGSWSTTWTLDTDFQLEPLNAGANVAGDGYAWWRIAAIGVQRFPVGGRRPSLRVTAKYGWTAVPGAVKQACLLRAAMLYKRRDSPLGVAGFGDFGPVRITRRDPHVVELLTPYIRAALAAV